MEAIDFKEAYYVKLGKGGEWEDSSIRENKLRVGWAGWPLDDINEGKWDQLQKKYGKGYKSKGSATTDLNALKALAASTSEDIWVTFHDSHLWWCRLGDTGILEDQTSKYRPLNGEWHNKDISGHILLANQIPGSIAKVQGFRATICKIQETDDLKRLINDCPSESYLTIYRVRDMLVSEIEKGLKRLHWKDFETLVDLLFRNAGWHRVSIKGERMKYADLELLEPITGDKYQVQVKSTATVSDFEEYAHAFTHGSFRKLYFVVHTPDVKLAEFQVSSTGNVELILPNRLSRMVVELGLTDWVLQKTK